MKRTALQLLREFWLPLLLALSWTAWKIVNSVTFSLSLVVETFGPSFFLLSWAAGQVNRVRKQARVEDSFASVQDRLGALVSKLEAQTQEIINHVTGGESFCGLMVAHGYVLLHYGDHTLYSVTARIVDLDMRDTASAGLPSLDRFATFGDISPNSATEVSELAGVLRDDWTALNIFFSARNGFFTQELRRSGSFPGAATASRITRNRGAERITLYEEIADAYPRREDGTIDWR